MKRENPSLFIFSLEGPLKLTRQLSKGNKHTNGDVTFYTAVLTVVKSESHSVSSIRLAYRFG